MMEMIAKIAVMVFWVLFAAVMLSIIWRDYKRTSAQPLRRSAMPKYPNLTDQTAWTVRLRDKYRDWHWTMLVMAVLLSFPFMAIKWLAEHGEAAFDILMDRNG